MVTITLKRIPKDIYSKLKTLAERNRRSLNSEVLYCLERYTLEQGAIDPEAFLARIDALRDEVGSVSLTDALLATARESGRP